MFLEAFLFIKTLLLKNAQTDNFVFRLHYRWTVAILATFSVVITCRSFVGYSFSCYSRSSDFSQSFLSMMCYTERVYTKQISHYNGIIGLTTEHDTPDIKKYYNYYTWVNLVLLVMAFLFYLPHLLWTIYEKKYMFKLTASINNTCFTDDKRNMELCVLAKYTLISQGKHKVYVVFYIFMEFTNFIISILQGVCLVHFFQIIKTPEIPDFKLETWSDFAKFYFPTKADCMYEIPGASGAMQRHQALCLLPLNQMYMYIFLFLYSWYTFLAVLSGSVLVYRLCLLFTALRVMTLTYAAPLCTQSVLRSMCDRLSYYDWFFLWRLRDNLTDSDFAQLVDKITAASRCGNVQGNDHEVQKIDELCLVNTPM